MCFETPRSRLAPTLTLVVGAVLLLTACGKKGDPMPPLRIVPQRTTDLEARQQGQLILLDLTYPSVTTSGLALSHVDAVELYGLVRPSAEGKVPPVDPKELETSAEILLTLRGAELDSAVTGDRIQIRVSLGDLPEPKAAEVAAGESAVESEEPEAAEGAAEATEAEPPAYIFAVRTVLAEESSPFSNTAAMIPREPPPPPQDLNVEATEDGVAVTWTPGDGEVVEAFDVFRRLAQERGYGDALQRLPGDQTELLDRTATFGNRYIYTVRTVASVQPLIYSPGSGEREIDYVDRFAPPLPASFVALGERGQVRLRWDASAATDVRGYVLYRKEPAREFHRITPEPVAEVELVDPGLATGVTFEYRIQVVDRSGNESPLSEPVSTTVR